MHIALVSSPKKSINFVRGHEIDKTAFVVDIQGGRIHPFCFVFFLFLSINIIALKSKFQRNPFSQA